ncbi:cell adhesion molecule Dscam2-like [Uloborus diversus]|uniref:cell adhesion molecule Dscam2-like n=1 Tax=Uloborus diversus TaxID=327109 RepID=UPI002409E06C|nr:cell adhesion molecule Dscam2-like [Uloborus diversus]
MRVTQTGSLIIGKVDSSMKGSYTCEAENGFGKSLRKTISISVRGPPKLQPIFLPEYVSSGEKVTAACAVKSGIRPLKFKWEKDGRNIEDIPNSSVDIQSDYSVMTIGPATKQNIGNYTCIVENSQGRDSYTVALVLKYVFLNEISEVPVQSDNHINVHANGTLAIPSVNYEDGGNYKCEATNNIDGSLHKKINILINVPPIVQPFNFPESASQGQRITATCGILQGSKILQFHWLKDGQALQGIPNTSVDMQAEYSVLTIVPASKSNVGNYTCIVKNDFGEDRHTASFSLKEPPIWKTEPYDIVGVEGQAVELHCSAEGSPKPQIKWKKREGEVEADLKDSMSVLSNGSLIIPTLKYEYTGIYLCEANNGIGKAIQKSISIQVHGIDLKPTVELGNSRRYLFHNDGLTITNVLKEDQGKYIWFASNGK